VLTLFTAVRCPYAARARIVLAEKGLEYEAIEIDLDDRPAWLYEKNPLGKVPVLEEDEGLVLPESVVIMEYLEERFPEPALWPDDPAERALGRLWIECFDDRLGRDYYALRRGGERAPLTARLEELDRVLEGVAFLSGQDYGLADTAYFPWVLRARENLGVELGPFPALAAWFDGLSGRPAIRAERELVAS
jgi:glutathione S-transferase